MTVQMKAGRKKFCAWCCCCKPLECICYKCNFCIECCRCCPPCLPVVPAPPPIPPMPCMGPLPPPIRIVREQVPVAVPVPYPVCQPTMQMQMPFCMPSAFPSCSPMPTFPFPFCSPQPQLPFCSPCSPYQMTCSYPMPMPTAPLCAPSPICGFPPPSPPQISCSLPCPSRCSPAGLPSPLPQGPPIPINCGGLGDFYGAPRTLPRECCYEVDPEIELFNPCPPAYPKRLYRPGCHILPGYEGHVPGLKRHGAGRTFGAASKDTRCIMSQWGNSNNCFSPRLPRRIFEQ